MDGWTDEWTGLTDSPYILLDCVPFGSLSGHCPAYITATIMKYLSRARVPMTFGQLVISQLKAHLCHLDFQFHALHQILGIKLVGCKDLGFFSRISLHVG